MNSSIEINQKKLFEAISFYGLILPFLAFLVGVKDPNLWLDYSVYSWYYEQAKNNTVIDIIKNIQDPLFTLFNKIFVEFGFDFSSFCLILAFYTLYLKFIGLRRSTSNFYILLFLYSSLILCLQDYTQVRVAFALSVLIFALYFIKNLIIKIILILASIFLHASVAIVILPFVFNIYFNKNTKMMYFYFILLSSFFYGSLKLLSEWSRFNQYLDNYTYYNIFASIPLLQSLTLIYLLCIYKKQAICFEYYVTLSGVSAYYFLFLTPAAATRYMEVCSVFFIIILSKYFNRDNIIKIICLLVFLLNFYNLFMKPNSFLYVYYSEFISIL